MRRTVVIHLALILRSGSCSLTRSASLLRQEFEGAPQCGTYLALLQVGFTKLLRSPVTLVSSYLSRHILCAGNPDLSGHLFTLSSPEEGWWFPFLWHFPSRYRDSALRSALPCGARTFLP